MGQKRYLQSVQRAQITAGDRIYHIKAGRSWFSIFQPPSTQYATVFNLIILSRQLSRKQTKAAAQETKCLKINLLVHCGFYGL